MVTTFQFITDGIATFVLCVLGIIGNTIAMVVLSRPQMKSSINCCLQNLAIYDTLFLIMKILNKVIPYTSYHIPQMLMVFRAIYPYSHWSIPLIHTVRTGSVWVTVGVSVERYIAVCYPLKARSFCTYRRSLLFNFFITVFVIVYNLPQFFRYEIKQKFHSANNSTYYVIAMTSFGSGELFYVVYDIWLSMVMLYVIPFSALVFLNFSIYKEMKRAFKARGKMCQQEEKEIHLAKMLFCVVAIFFVCYLPSFVFFVCYLPSLIFSIIENAEDGERFQGKTPSILNLTEAIYSSMNCIVYYALASNFRKAFMRIFCNHP